MSVESLRVMALLGISDELPQCPTREQHVQREEAPPGNNLHLISSPLSLLPVPPYSLPFPKGALGLNAVNNISVILSTLITTHQGNGPQIHTQREYF